jgi:hypothetical protein
MKITENKKTFNEAVLDTPIGAIAVKKRDKDLRELSKDSYGHGILVTPTILCGTIHGPDDLEFEMIDIHAPVVMVRGHGWDFEAPFVWTGSTEEFNETWVID